MRGKHGFTVVEMLVATVIGLAVFTAVASLSIMGGRMYKSIFTQQTCLRMAKEVDGRLHGLNREIRMALEGATSKGGLSVTSPTSDGHGHTITYTVPTDTAHVRSFTPESRGGRGLYHTLGQHSGVFLQRYNAGGCKMGHPAESHRAFPVQV